MQLDDMLKMLRLVRLGICVWLWGGIVDMGGGEGLWISVVGRVWSWSGWSGWWGRRSPYSCINLMDDLHYAKFCT